MKHIGVRSLPAPPSRAWRLLMVLAAPTFGLAVACPAAAVAFASNQEPASRSRGTERLWSPVAEDTLATAAPPRHVALGKYRTPRLDYGGALFVQLARAPRERPGEANESDVVIVLSPMNQDLTSQPRRGNAEHRRSVAEETVQGAPPELLQDVTLGRGRGLLKDEKCMIPSSAGPEQWGLRQASREFLIKKGLTASYFDKHFCAIAVTYEYREDFPNRGYGVAWVTYKAMFAPYLTWWQHHFPVLVGADKRPELRDGTAAIDLSGKTVLVQEVEMREIHRLLPPEDLRRRMQALIGAFVGPLQVLMGLGDSGRGTGRTTLRLYVYALNMNPNSRSCADTDRIGTIDVETGEGVVRYTGACP